MFFVCLSHSEFYFLLRVDQTKNNGPIFNEIIKSKNMNFKLKQVFKMIKIIRLELNSVIMFTFLKNTVNESN